MRKSLVLIGLPILLGGCGLPPAISIASWALDGVSYLASGKSVTDHAISQVAGSDCALFRIVQNREICERIDGDEGGAPILSALALTRPEPVQSAMAPSDPDFVAPDIVEFAEAFGPEAVRVEELETLPVVPASFTWQPPVQRDEAADDGRYLAAAPKQRPVPAVAPVATSAAAPASRLAPAVGYVSVVGSFQYADNASALAARLAHLGGEVRTVRTGGETWHRVITTASLSDVQNAGFEDAWILKVCGDASDAAGAAGSCAFMQADAGPATTQLAQAN